MHINNPNAACSRKKQNKKSTTVFTTFENFAHRGALQY